MTPSQPIFCNLSKSSILLTPPLAINFILVFAKISSYNSKDVNLFEIQVMGKTVKANLQRSLVRTETGGTQVTYAIELETEKVLKKDLAKFSEELMKALPGLESSDVGGGSPSPSLLTLKVLNQVL